MTRHGQDTLSNSADSPREHEIQVELSSGARLKVLFFSDRELRWIFSYRYRGGRTSRRVPEIVNDVRLSADYADGFLSSRLTLSMHVVVPARLGQQICFGVDVSPGAKTYLEFSYERGSAADYRLAEVCKGARGRVRLDDLGAGLVRPAPFPFPVPDRLSVDFGRVRVPFLRDDDVVAYFELPTSTLRASAGVADVSG